MSVTPTILGPEDGPCYDWSNDNTRVLVGTAESSGAFTLVEDRMRASFRLGRHIHREHSETFFVLEGALEFIVGERTVRAVPGAAIHVPPGTVHGVRVLDGLPARMLMIYAPAGFDRYLEKLVALGAEESADPAVMAALDAEHDIIKLEP
jgi:quercetin dioxygenase-like cupin family protein